MIKNAITTMIIATICSVAAVLSWEEMRVDSPPESTPYWQAYSVKMSLLDNSIKNFVLEEGIVGKERVHSALTSLQKEAFDSIYEFHKETGGQIFAYGALVEPKPKDITEKILKSIGIPVNDRSFEPGASEEKLKIMEELSSLKVEIESLKKERRMDRLLP